MAALKTPQRKTSSRKELRQDRIVTLYAQAWLFYEENRKLVYAALAGFVILVAAIVGYFIYQNQQQAEAENLLANVVGHYEQGNYREALEGPGTEPGLLEIADDYGSTRAGNLATYYAADAHYRLGEYDEALELYQQFDETDDFIGAGALAAQAAIYESREEYARAAELYEQAAEQYESSLTSPQYLLRAGRAYEEAGDYDAALSTYERIESEYADSDEAQDISRYVARARAKQNSAS